jgi:hypothetical protein
MNITINPTQTQNASGSFNISSKGLIQGTAFPDPATRYALAGGLVASDETLPMWGGVGIYAFVPGLGGTAPRAELGPIVGRATSLSGAKNLNGFSVFDQAYGMVNSPNSPVPLIGSGGQAMYYLLGSGARIAVAADDELVSLINAKINPQVSWDFLQQRLIPYVGTLTISSGTYDDDTGEIVLTMSAPITFGDGDGVVISSLTGTGAYASLNGTYVAEAGTEAGGTTVYLTAEGSLVLGSGASSALNVRVLDVQAANNMTVSYDAETGYATWNRDGAAAVILI